MSHQSFPKATGSIPDGYVLTYSAVDGYWVPRQVTQSRYTPIDSNTIINWKFDETSGPYVNSGVGSTLSLTNFIGTSYSVTGIFNKALGCTNTIISTGNTSVNEPNGTSVTVSAWVKARAFPAYGVVINKAYRNDNTWNSPYVSLYISLTASGDGSWAPAIAVGGSYVQPTQTGVFRIPLHQWTLLAFTYDGTNLRSYINGALSGTTSFPGQIDYGTHGPWDVGGVSNATIGQYWDGHIDDIRVENVVRSQSYLEAMYKTGLNLKD